MMIKVGYKYSRASKAALFTVHAQLQQLFLEALDTSLIDWGIPETTGGRRTTKCQAELFDLGESKCDGVKIKSKHQSGLALDVVAYVNGEYTYDPRYYYMIAMHIYSTAWRLGLEVRWGGDWDSDWDFKDQTFNDLGHFELILTASQTKE